MRMVFMQLQDGLLDLPVQHPWPEFDRMVQVGIAGRIGSHIPERSIEEDGRSLFLLRKACYQRPVPDDLMVSHPHGRVEEPIPEEPPLFDRLDGCLHLTPAGLGPVEDEAILLIPDLGVLGHGFPVQVQIGGLGAEENMEDFIFPGGNFELILMAVNPGPAMGPFEGTADRAVFAGGEGTVRVGFIDPARLGNPQAMGTFVALYDLQKGDLAGQG